MSLDPNRKVTTAELLAILIQRRKVKRIPLWECQECGRRFSKGKKCPKCGSRDIDIS